jgi:hypothetical protein
MKKYPILEPVLIVLIGIFVVIVSQTIEVIVTSIAIGPDFMPCLIGVLFILLGLGLVPECLEKQKAANAARAVAAPVEKSKLSFKELTLKYMHYIMWVWALIYALLMKKVGFLFDSILFLFVSMVLLTIREKKRNWAVIILVSIIVPTFVYILFRQKFYLMLPMGICKYIPLKILR